MQTTRQMPTLLYSKLKDKMKDSLYVSKEKLKNVNINNQDNITLKSDPFLHHHSLIELELRQNETTVELDKMNIEENIFPTLSSSPTNISPIITTQLKNVFCVNCGEKGHVVKECVNPITSFGIIAFKVVNQKFEEIFDKNENLEKILKSINGNEQNLEKEFSWKSKRYQPKIKFLMVQRKDTMGFIDFIRGKYSSTDQTEKKKKIYTCLNEMTMQEKQALLTKTFDQLWSDLWVNKNSRVYQNEYKGAKEKYNLLNIEELLSQSKSLFTFQEFSFPKGRRNMKETNIMCAEREFYEETGYDKSTYEFIKDYPIIKEEFLGTNGVKYRHIYYLVKMKNNVRPPKVDVTNMLQTGEIQNLGWFTLNECLSLIRPYDTEKKNVIIKVHNDIIKMNNNYNCSRYYTMPMRESDLTSSKFIKSSLLKKREKTTELDDIEQVSQKKITFIKNKYLYSNDYLIEANFT